MPRQPTASIKVAIKGDITAVPIPPAPQSRPITNPNLLRNQRLTAAMSGTIDIDCVIDNMTPNVRKKCQACVMIPINIMLDAYRSPPDIIINRGPYRSPNQPLIGENAAPTK